MSTKKTLAPSWANDDRLRKAMELALRILGDRYLAREAVMSALERHDAKLHGQDKRLYYAAQDHTKISWSEPQLLQVLTVEAANKIARNKEWRGRKTPPESEKTMIIRWISYLFDIAKGNSFGMCVAYAKILHDGGPHGTQQAMNLYELLQQAPCAKDASQFPRKRADLMEKMKLRFRDWVNFTRNPNGEIAFATHPNPSRHLAEVTTLFTLLAPWDVTPPAIPEKFDPTQDRIPDLASSNDQDAQNETEKRRLFSLLNQEYCSRLVAAVTIKPFPIILPAFAMAGDQESLNDGAGSDRDRTWTCSDEDIDSIRDHFNRRRLSRDKAQAIALRIMVDDQAREEIEFSKCDSVDFLIAKDEERIDVYDISGKSPILLVTVDLMGLVTGSLTLRCTLGRGQQLTLTLTGTDANGRRRAHFSYAETLWHRRWTREARRKLTRLNPVAQHPATAYRMSAPLENAPTASDPEISSGKPDPRVQSTRQFPE
jgi:hypothetical protein